MKSNRGITLIVLVIYMIVITIIIGVLATMTDNFFKNTKYITDKGKYISEFNKFNMYFIEDVKNNSSVYKISTNEIVFNDGTVYTFKSSPDYGIYRNKVKICTNVESCEFTKENKVDNDVEKTIINVEMVMKSSTPFETSTRYVLKYW